MARTHGFSSVRAGGLGLVGLEPGGRVQSGKWPRRTGQGSVWLEGSVAGGGEEGWVRPDNEGLVGKQLRV